MNRAEQHCSQSESALAWMAGQVRNTRALKRVLVITLVVMLVELAGGYWTNSLALLADAGHMLTDAAAIALSLFAVWIVRRPSTAEKTYGYHRVEILAAFINGTALVVIALLILSEAYQRFLRPENVRSLEMLVIAAVGLVANLVCARTLHSGHLENLNIRGAFLHVIGDILGSIGALTAGLAMLIWSAYWADPLVSGLVSLLILISAWRLVRDSVTILLEGAPAHVNLSAMRLELSSVPGVESVHDLHVWTLTSGVHVMTCHAVVGTTDSHDGILRRMNAISQDKFHIQHTTIQIEEGQVCGSS